MFLEGGGVGRAADSAAPSSSFPQLPLPPPCPGSHTPHPLPSGLWPQGTWLEVDLVKAPAVGLAGAIVGQEAAGPQR